MSPPAPSRNLKTAATINGRFSPARIFAPSAQSPSQGSAHGVLVLDPLLRVDAEVVLVVEELLVDAVFWERDLLELPRRGSCGTLGFLFGPVCLEVGRSLF